MIIGSNTDINGAGNLLIVAPISDFRPGFGIRNGGQISVHSESLP